MFSLNTLTLYARKAISLKYHIHKYCQSKTKDFHIKILSNGLSKSPLPSQGCQAQSPPPNPADYPWLRADRDPDKEPGNKGLEHPAVKVAHLFHVFSIWMSISDLSLSVSLLLRCALLLSPCIPHEKLTGISLSQVAISRLGRKESIKLQAFHSVVILSDCFFVVKGIRLKGLSCQVLHQSYLLFYFCFMIN